MKKRLTFVIALRLAIASLVVPVLSFQGACTAKPNAARLDYQMGERATVGSLTYNVVETTWKSQLGDGLRIRTPEQRFLLISISVTNGGGREISVPMLQLEDQQGHLISESSDGEGVDSWFGMLRNIDPAQTQQGRIVFDVPLSSYRLRITDGNESSEKFAWVSIPLRMDTDVSIDTPTPGAGK